MLLPPSAHPCRNDQRRNLGRIVRRLARRSEGMAAAELAGAVRCRYGAAVGLPDLRGPDRTHADRTDPQVVCSFLLINAATILLLVGIIVREVWQVIQARRRGRAAARLHVQIVSLFSIIAVLPAVLVAVVANVTIERGLDRLFSGPTSEVIQNSLIIARAYMHEHAQLIRGDILGMANDIAHARPLFDQDRRTFRELLTASAASRNLPGAMLIDKDANILEIAQNRHPAGLHAAAAGIPQQRQRRPSPRSRCSRKRTTSPP